MAAPTDQPRRRPASRPATRSRRLPGAALPVSPAAVAHRSLASREAGDPLMYRTEAAEARAGLPAELPAGSVAVAALRGASVAAADPRVAGASCPRHPRTRRPQPRRRLLRRLHPRCRLPLPCLRRPSRSPPRPRSLGTTPSRSRPPPRPRPPPRLVWSASRMWFPRTTPSSATQTWSSVAEVLQASCTLQTTLRPARRWP
mmetsp:Transcript_4621/g.16270  ORF Transcript_4621/g.16270 Transcript_4621/m.16270 type:complete len:201 (-) Transcript_4621:800-1402(-)